MTADHGSDSGRQRTVAELLQQYGGDSQSGGGRRRRRAAESDDAPRPRAEEEPPARPPETEQRFEPAPRSGDLGGTAALDSTWASLESPASRTLNPNTGGFDARNGSGSFSASPFDALGPAAAPGSPWDTPPRGAPSAPPTDAYTSSSPYSGTGIYQAQPYPTGIYQSDPVSSSVPVRPPEQATDQLPRYRDRAGAAEATQLTSPAGGGPRALEGPADPSRTRAVEDSGPSTAVASRAALFDDADAEEDAAGDLQDDDDQDGDGGKAGGGWAARIAARKKARAAESAGARDDGDDDADADVPAGLDDEDDVELAQSGFKVWAVLIAQGVLGAVGGAGLWIGFSYLWRNLPVVALVAAVVATGGLVLMVRTIRGSDDLRTTMLAVLVGLVVTISPVALMIATWVR